MCLHHRDYGMRAFSERGYNTILIRDCTTAVETHDTVDELLTTKVSVQELEMQRAFSMTSADFIAACGTVSKARLPVDETVSFPIGSQSGLLAIRDGLQLPFKVGG